MLRRFAFLVFLAATSSAMGGQAQLGEVSVNLPPPQGFCDLSAAYPSDSRLLSAIGGLLGQGGNKLLGISADCGQLADWRSGRRPLLDDYAQYQTRLTTIDKPPSETIKQACASLRAEGEKILSNKMPDFKARIEAALTNVKVNQVSFIGVLAEEPRACYARLIQQVKTQAGTTKTQLNLFAVTTVKNRAIFVYRFAVYKDPDSITTMLPVFKKEVAAFFAAN